ncbi:hypothetical protein SPILM97S_01274 [Streptomyces pilosus]
MGEQVFVGEGDVARPGARGGVDRLVDAFDLGRLAGVGAVGGDDAVRDERSVVGVVAPVAAVGEERPGGGTLPLGPDGGGVEPEPYAVVAGAAAVVGQFGGGEGAGVDAGAAEGAAELAGLVVGVGGEGEGGRVAAGPPVGGAGGPQRAVGVQTQGPGVGVEDPGDVVFAAGPAVRQRPVGGDPLAVGVDEELQPAVGLFQRVLGVALGDEGLVVAEHVRGDPGLQGEGAGEVEAVVAFEDRDAGQAPVAVEGAAGGEDLAAQAGRARLGEQGAGRDRRVEGLVGEVPDPAALEDVVAADDVPVLPEVSVGVPHRVGVLDHDVRAGVGGVPGALLDPCRALVHAGADVAHAGAVVALVLDDAGGVVGADPVVHRGEGAAASGLVAERPDDHRGVVLVTVHHVPGAGDAGRRPPGVAAGVLGTDAVGLEVGLVDEVEAVLVGEFVPQRVVRVVRGADGVDVRPLDEADVLDQVLAGEGGAAGRVHLVAVGAAERDGPAVDPHQPVPDRELAEAHPVGQGLHHLAGRVAEPEDGRVEVRLLGRPQPRRGHGLRGPHGDVRSGGGRGEVGGLLERAGPDGVAARVVQLRFHGVPAARGLADGADARGDRQLGGRVAVVQRGVQLEVAQVHGRDGVEVDRAEDAAQPDHVLVLQPVAVRVAVHLHGDLVGAGLQTVGDVVLGGCVGVLVVADEFAVDPHVVGGLDALEVQEGAAARPVARDGEGAPVLADRVVAGGGGGRLGVLAASVGAPVGVGDVQVDREVVAVQLPHGRHREGLPVAVVGVRAVEVGVPVVGAVGVGELPGAVQAQPVGRAGAVAGECLTQVGVRHERGVRRLGADGEDTEVVPLRGRVGRGPPAGGRVRGARRGGQGEGAEDGGAGLQETAAADDRPGGAGGPVGGRHVGVRHGPWPSSVRQGAARTEGASDPPVAASPGGGRCSGEEPRRLVTERLLSQPHPRTRTQPKQ